MIYHNYLFKMKKKMKLEKIKKKKFLVSNNMNLKIELIIYLSINLISQFALL